MFQRVIVDEWMFCLPVVSFAVFAVVFLLVTVRALRLGKAECRRLASLPLEENAATPEP